MKQQMYVQYHCCARLSVLTLSLLAAFSRPILREHTEKFVLHFTMIFRFYGKVLCFEVQQLICYA